jgi:hypothetical protein
MGNWGSDGLRFFRSQTGSLGWFRKGTLFGITTADDFFAKLEADYVDFKAQPDSARLALNCIITAYHLHEWVWGRWLKSDTEAKQKIGIADKGSFITWLDGHWPGFTVVQELTNGAKHLKTMEKVKDTDLIAGFGRGPYGVGPYGSSYLLIDYGDNTAPQRWNTAETLLDEALAFWRKFFNTYRIKTLA